MYICILDDDDPEDQLYPYAPEFYLKGHKWEKIFLNKATSVIQIKELSTKGYDVVLNLCDGAWAEDRPGIEVVNALEYYNMAFTGADSHFFEPTREEMKMACEVNGLSFPRGIQVSSLNEIHLITENLNFPLLVKHSNSYASVGLTPDSKVNNESELRVQIERFFKLFGSCLVEEFIEGTEFSVLVVENPDNYEEPVIFTPIEVVFADGETFKHEKLKWVDYNKISCRPVTDVVLRKELEEMGQKVFTSLRGTGYGRCDIRRDKEGKLFLLEINPNGAVLYPPSDPGTADHILSLDPRGHEHFVDLLLRSALVQQKLRDKGWKLHYMPKTGFGLCTTRQFKKGEVVLNLEELPHRTMSHSGISDLSKDEIARFFTSAFHIAKDLFYAPAKYPPEWVPMEHSCDPNLWFQSHTLRLIARKDLNKGACLSVDYATLFTEELPSFECPCGAETCRKHITGSDYKQVGSVLYKSHCSPYIEELAS